MKNDDVAALIRRRDALKRGVSVRAFDSAVARGELVAVGRGVYIDARAVRGKPRYRQRQILYRHGCLAAASPAIGDRVLSHESAAALHRLDVLRPDRKHVHFTNRKVAGGHAKGRITVLHPGTVSSDDVVEIDGVRVTSLARTVVDVALSSPFSRALAVFDAGLREGLEAGDLRERLKAPRRGAAAARYALGHADALAANPGESWCRAQMIEAGFPKPALQRRYDFTDGTHAEVDLLIENLVVVEFDGISKYSGDYLREGQTPADVVVAEKEREDKLRELGLDVIRALWAHLSKNTMLTTVAAHLQRHGLWTPPPGSPHWAGSRDAQPQPRQW